MKPWLFYVCKYLLLLFAHGLYYRTKVIDPLGQRKLLKTKHYLIASNHLSNFDPPLIGSIFPGKMRFFAKQELFANKRFGQFITWVGAVPVDRQQVHKSQIENVIKLIKDDKQSMLMFPAGTRKGTQPKPGISKFAYHGQVDVLPVYIRYPKHFWGRLRITVGRVISTNDFLKAEPDNKQAQDFAQFVWNKITGLQLVE